MSAIVLFFGQLVATMSVVFVALWYLRNPLYALLADLCGTAERARFWAAFSDVTLFLVPFAIALGAGRVTNDWPGAVFETGGQIESAIIGFVVSVVALGLILSIHIGRIATSDARETVKQ